MDYDWSKFDVYIYIDADPSEVIRRWTTADGLESFFVKRAVFTAPDGRTRAGEETVAPRDRYLWQWWHGVKSDGEVLEVDSANRVVFTFGKDITVAVSVSSSGERTLVHLTQANMPTDEQSRVRLHLDCRGGWIYFLTILKGVLEHGVDARDKGETTAGSLALDFRPDR